jgi:AcrR family transcriptional regulator
MSASNKVKPARARSPGSGAQDPRRGAILNAAFLLFTQRGFDATSTLDIATRARVSKRELYQLFDDKQAMLAACISERAARMRHPLDLPAPHDQSTLVAVLTSFGATFLREITQPAVVAVYRLAAQEAERSPDVARMLDSAGRETNRNALIDLFRTAQASGLLAGGEPAQMASEFFGLLLGDLLLRLVLRVAERPTADEIDRRTRVATDAVLRLHTNPQL